MISVGRDPFLSCIVSLTELLMEQLLKRLHTLLLAQTESGFDNPPHESPGQSVSDTTQCNVIARHTRTLAKCLQMHKVDK